MTFQAILFILIIASCVAFYIWKLHKDMQLLKTVTHRYRGEWSERKTVLKLLKMGIDPRAIFHDCYIKKPNGSYTQVDLVVATKVGLIVFEIKDYSGWIFGNFRQKYWTQILAYGKEKHRFFNPIMQNNGHIQAIRDNLPTNSHIPIYSIIVFFGSSELKNVTIGSDNDYLIYPREIVDTVNEILSHPNANFGDKYEIMNLFKQAVANGNVPEIVSAQHSVAYNAGRYKPESSYSFSVNPFYLFRRFRR